MSLRSVFLRNQISPLSVGPGRRGGENRNLHLLDLSKSPSVNVGHDLIFQTPDSVRQLFVIFVFILVIDKFVYINSYL